MEHLNQKIKQAGKTNDHPFLSLSMGMIQPEWLYMSHFFEEPHPPQESNTFSLKKTQPTKQRPIIRIQFRARK